VALRRAYWQRHDAVGRLSEIVNVPVELFPQSPMASDTSRQAVHGRADINMVATAKREGAQPTDSNAFAFIEAKHEKIASSISYLALKELPRDLEHPDSRPEREIATPLESRCEDLDFFPEFQKSLTKAEVRVVVRHEPPYAGCVDEKQDRRVRIPPANRELLQMAAAPFRDGVWKHRNLVAKQRARFDFEECLSPASL
jgi:hypothetical protein